MFKLVMLIRKRADLTREQFIDYYDNHHVPLMHRIQPCGAAVHRRNFVVPGAAGTTDYDVISEVFYEDAATAASAAKALDDPELRRQMLEDENNFIEPGSIRRFVVEVHETVFRPLPP
jgi:uncharacterized protein (TIGR02118 family)